MLRNYNFSLNSHFFKQVPYILHIEIANLFLILDYLFFKSQCQTLYVLLYCNLKRTFLRLVVSKY